MGRYLFFGGILGMFLLALYVVYSVLSNSMFL